MLIGMAFSPDERSLSVISERGDSYMIEMSSMTVPDGLKFDTPALSTVMSPDGLFSAVAYLDGSVLVRKLSTNRTVVLSGTRNYSNHRIKFSADSKSVITGFIGNSLRVWHFDDAEMPSVSPHNIVQWLDQQTQVEVPADALGIAPPASAP